MEEENNNIIETPIEQELETSYLGYSMSVIYSRALPDARDGLKPVHRRVLYTMLNLDLKHNTAFKKSARIVGDVMGKYHPHGDSAIYETMVRMAQNWSMSGTLVDGQGNFGSIDGDPPAAYRYTEARMSKLGEQMLEDIGKDTVDFQDNFDGSLSEPVVLPSKFPNLLVNGSEGIAVGMATKIPPHNLGEIIDACIHLIDNPKSTLEDLLKFVKGPDFPTGAYILGSDGFKSGYKSGRGRVVMRSKTSLEEKGKKNQIIIHEIPYQVNKTTLIQNIVELVKTKKVEGISDIRDESDKKGMRVVVELKKGENPELILNHLYKQTPLQTSFNLNMLALVQGKPETLNLERMLNIYLAHRVDVTTRRTRHELQKAEARQHLLQGYVKILEDIEKAVKIIKGSQNNAEARSELEASFGISETQSKNVLNMRLSSLTSLEIEKIKNELKELEDLIGKFKSILGNRSKLYSLIKKELKKVRDEFAVERRTEILPDYSEIDIRDLLENTNKIITITNTGYIKATDSEEYNTQKRGGKGSQGLNMREEDFVSKVFVAKNFDYVMFFTNKGRCFSKYAYSLPEGGKTSRGKAIVNILNLAPNEKVTAIIPVNSEKDGEFTNGDSLFITMATKYGLVKKTSLLQYISSTRESGINAIKFGDEDDEVVSVKISDNSKELVLGTYQGKCIRFNEELVRSVGRVSKGVKGIELKPNDYIVGMEILDPKDKPYLVAITELGFGKKTEFKEYRKTARGGKGVINIKTSSKSGKVIGFFKQDETQDVIIISQQGKIIRVPYTDIPTYGRSTQGVKLIRLQESDRIMSTAVCLCSNDEDEQEDSDE